MCRGARCGGGAKSGAGICGARGAMWAAAPRTLAARGAACGARGGGAAAGGRGAPLESWAPPRPLRLP
jgi:hypothetical protein